MRRPENGPQRWGGDDVELFLQDDDKALSSRRRRRRGTLQRMQQMQAAGVKEEGEALGSKVEAGTNNSGCSSAATWARHQRICGAGVAAPAMMSRLDGA